MAPPIQPPQPWLGYYPQNLTDFQPKARIVIAINFFPSSHQAVVQTSVPHEYNTGLIVKFYSYEQQKYPDFFTKYYPITVLSADTFSIPIDRVTYVFNVGFNQSFQVVPSAERTINLNSAMNNQA